MLKAVLLGRAKMFSFVYDRFQKGEAGKWTFFYFPNRFAISLCKLPRNANELWCLIAITYNRSTEIYND